MSDKARWFADILESDADVLILRVGGKVSIVEVSITSVDLELPLQQFVDKCITAPVAAAIQPLKARL